MPGIPVLKYVYKNINGLIYNFVIINHGFYNFYLGIKLKTHTKEFQLLSPPPSFDSIIRPRKEFNLLERTLFKIRMTNTQTISTESL